MLNAGHDLAFGCAIAGQLVGDHDSRRPHLLLQQLAQQPLGCLLVASAVHEDVEHHAGLIHRPPQPVLHTGDLEHDLIEMPFVARPRQAATDMTGELLAKFACPLPYGFVADDDAARGQQLLHHAKTEREAEIQPHGMSDDLGREAISGIAGSSGCRHSTRLLTPIPRRKWPGSTKLTVPFEGQSAVGGPAPVRDPPMPAHKTIPTRCFSVWAATTCKRLRTVDTSCR